MLMIAIISVPFFPRFADYRKLNEEGREVAARRDKLKAQLEEKEAELRMIETDPQFLELKARDLLNYAKEGEVVFRFEKGK
jgi:cell division protein FtsB